MLETMYVHCAHCGYDNSPEYRFCGMCGASLAHPTAAIQTTTAKEAPLPANGERGNGDNVHGPSFLGLAEDPKVEFHYLYEDEQPRSHVGAVVFLLLILGAAGYLGWQWKHGGFPFNRQMASSSTGGGQPSASPSEVAPAQTQDQETHIDKPMTGGAGTVQPLPPEPQQQSQQQKTQAADSGSKPEGPPAKTDKDLSAAGTAPADESASTEKADKTAEDNEASAPPTPAKTKAPKQASVRTPVAKAAPQPATSPDANLEVTGERYLYGNGMPQNCTRAESSLRTAATHGNSKAQTVLGTMYATGHCVGRDLPTAYRWFARALHQEPQNSRISADLQVLWRQMSPQEKQLATSSAQ